MEQRSQRTDHDRQGVVETHTSDREVRSSPCARPCNLFSPSASASLDVARKLWSAMTTGSDLLLEHLLFQVALAGNPGLSITALSDAFIEYNEKTHVDEDDANNEDVGDLLFSLKPPGAKSDAHLQASDPQHLEKLWSWLVDHPDITIKQADSQKDGQSEGLAAPDLSNPLTPVFLSHANERLLTTEHRVWHALTDHDVDWKRVPKLEFICLQVIAAAGRQGILQPDVTRLTGQDKRSVPKRTDSLASKGYITKELCLGGGIKTSILRLKKLVQEGPTETIMVVKGEAGRGEGGTRSMINYEQWYGEVIATLKKHNGIIAYEDLRKEMGIHGLRWQTRALHRCIKRLEKGGCIRRLKAKLENNDSHPQKQDRKRKRRQSSDGQSDDNADEDLNEDVEENVDHNAPNQGSSSERVSWVRCIKLMREPVDKDKDAFVSTVKGPLTKSSGGQEGSDAEGDADADADEDDEYAEIDDTALDGLGKTTEISTRVPPQWQPDMHHNQFTFHMIANAGTKGLSTMELADTGLGHFWRRPLDEILSRLSDVWTVSQPLHLRHLAVIRDTSQLHRISHYVFRSYENFQTLVDRGEAAWEAIGIQPAELQKKPELDAWGFPKVKSSSMAGHDGSYNMATCKNTIIRSKPIRPLFEKRTSSTYTPKPPKSRASIAQLSDVEATPLGEDSRASPLSTRKPKKTQYKELFRMNPKRVEAELKAWKARSHKLAVFRAKQELGITKKDVPRPRKRRKTKNEVVRNEEAGAERTDPQSSNLSDAAANAASVTSATGPETQSKVSAPEVEMPHSQSPAQSQEQLDENKMSQPVQQTDQSGAQASTDTTVQANGQNTSDSDLDKRVTDIEQQILNMSKPGIYINPPGSGQTKNDVTQPKGRPSRYLIAVFKSDKLKNISWFNAPETLQRQSGSRLTATPEPGPVGDQSATPDSSEVVELGSRAAEHISESPSSVDATGPKHDIVIKGGRRIQVQRQGKRKAYEPLRQRVTKKLAVESSIDQGKWKSAFRLEQAYSSRTESVSPPNTPSRQAVAVESSPKFVVINDSHQQRTDAGSNRTTDHNDDTSHQRASNANRPGEEVDYVQAQAQKLVDMAGSVEKTTAGAAESDVEMDDASSVVSQDKQALSADHQDATRRTAEPATQEKQPSASQDMEQPAANSAFASTPSRIMAPFMRRALKNTPANTSSDKTAEEIVEPNTPDSASRRASLIPDATPVRPSRAKAPNKVGVGRAGGIVSFNRLRVVQEIINKNGGMFGGERDLYYPFVTIWQRLYHRKPDRHTLDRVLDTLVESGKLKRITFAFTSTARQSATKTMVMEPHIDPESSEVQDFKQKMIEHFPMSYVPESTDMAPELRLRLEHDHRSGKPYEGNTVKTFFKEDPSQSVSRIEGPNKVQLGMTEARMQKGVHARRRRREEEERRQQRYMQAQMEEEIDEAVAALTTDFQLDSYQHDPKRAIIDRGPRGRGRLAKLQRWGVEDQNIPKRALGLLTANGADVDAHEAEQNSRDAVAASDFGMLRMFEAPEATEYVVPPTQVPRVHFEPEERSESLAQILQSQRPLLNVIEVLSMTSPATRFHPSSGTYSTDPVVITTSNIPSQHGMQIPRSLTDIFQQAVEEATSFHKPADPAQIGQYEVPQFAAVGVTRLPRLHTARPRPPPKPFPEYKVVGHKANMPRATRTGIFSMSEKEEQRLIYAVVVVKTLTGGLEQIVNWGLVHQVFHYKFDPNYCRHRWVALRGKLGGTADKLQVEFQKLFLEAYERGELPGIDFVEPEKYDWLAVVEWAEARLARTSAAKGLPDLPKSRELFDERFEIKNATEIYNIPREDFWISNVTQLRREELANSWSFIRPLSKPTETSIEDSELILALSWVRANVVTPDAIYDGNKAHLRLSKIENDLPRALEHLLGAKIIRMENKGRQIPGRNYDISDQVLTMFKRQWDVRFLKATAAFKKTIDHAFAVDGKLTISHAATDPEMTAMTNLVSSGRAKVIPLLPPTNHTFGAPFPRLTKWGFMEGNYKTVHMDKSRLHFGLELHPTANYIPGTPINMPRPPLSKQFPGEIGPRLPLWTDIHGDLIQVYWDMTLMATLWLLAFRPGLKAQDMARNAYKGKLWTWEVDMFLEWAERAGLAKRIGRVEVVGQEVGWMVDEWWWLAFAES